MSPSGQKQRGVNKSMMISNKSSDTTVYAPALQRRVGNSPMEKINFGMMVENVAKSGMGNDHTMVSPGVVRSLPFMEGGNTNQEASFEDKLINKVNDFVEAVHAELKEHRRKHPVA